MAAIYFHIPFCKQACHYCNFHFSTQHHYIDLMVNSMLQELTWRKDELQGEAIQSIYFGGGTPSLLLPQHIHTLLQAVYNQYHLSPSIEITLECNPDDINKKILKQWKEYGVNRLSMGVQSFQQSLLTLMNRIHNQLQAIQSIEWSLQCGFTNMSIDLIYGFPHTHLQQWESELSQVCSFHLPHLSCYALTVEPRTALAYFIQQKKIGCPSNEVQADMFLYTHQYLQERGYVHYEISNFCLPNYYSKHNTNYWGGGCYIGIGPSAHSYIQGYIRKWNVSNNIKYMAGIQDKKMNIEEEHLHATQQLNEYIMLALRTAKGMSIKKITHQWGIEASKKILQKSIHFIEEQLLIQKDDDVYPTIHGMLIADKMILALME